MVVQVCDNSARDGHLSLDIVSETEYAPTSVCLTDSSLRCKYNFCSIAYSIRPSIGSIWMRRNIWAHGPWVSFIIIFKGNSGDIGVLLAFLSETELDMIFTRCQKRENDGL